jgi:uncharacterized protein (DUF3820 family)|tara:strand:- start:131 stop:400 length:270 start_codon:yes stop_codon:yes gene_type:complete
MYPKNRHLLVEPVDSEESQVLVALPEEYLPVKEHEVVKILKVATDCIQFTEQSVRTNIVIPGNMLISFTYQGFKHYLVQENYVLAQTTN